MVIDVFAGILVFILLSFLFLLLMYVCICTHVLIASFRHDLPIEEAALLEPQEESMPLRQVSSEAVMDTTSHVSSVEDDVTTSQEEMVTGINFSSPPPPPQEESTSSQEPTSGSGSYRASSRDRQRERRQALMREREELWARRHDRFMDPMEVSYCFILLRG